jgi:hypothetical protein
MSIQSPGFISIIESSNRSWAAPWISKALGESND